MPEKQQQRKPRQQDEGATVKAAELRVPGTETAASEDGEAGVW